MTPDEEALSLRMMTTWARFAHNGEPGFDAYASSKLAHVFSTPCDTDEPVDSTRLAYWEANYVTDGSQT